MLQRGTGHSQGVARTLYIVEKGVIRSPANTRKRHFPFSAGGFARISAKMIDVVDPALYCRLNIKLAHDQVDEVVAPKRVPLSM